MKWNVFASRWVTVCQAYNYASNIRNLSPVPIGSDCKRVLDTVHVVCCTCLRCVIWLRVLVAEQLIKATIEWH